ncbi:MAG: DUF2294 domain-containing protein [Leptolyngbyaceae cyanobacterium SL_7_1]|nr:DUF2294 domain-containing protein [Leptolyngbyaceae cyanobacterium SL_7_1]
MTVSMMTSGQMERMLSQRIQALYRNSLGHQPGKVTCQLFESKVAIVIEDSITPPEQLLAEQGQRDLAEQIRSGLDDVIQPQIKDLIEEILNVSVLDLLTDATLDTGRTGIIAILTDVPEVSNPTNIPKVKKK